MKVLTVGLFVLIMCFVSVPVMASSSSAYSRIELYKNMAQLEQVDSVGFVSAAKQYAETQGLVDHFEQQIGDDEFGLTLVGKKINEKSYIWTFTEKEKVITVELITIK